MSGPSRSTWFVRRQPRPRAAMRLYCFGLAGSNASLFQDWSDHMPAEIEVCAVQLPGRQKRLREPPARRLEPVADTLAELISADDLPYCVFGACTGALLAYEAVCRVRACGGAEPYRFFATCCRAPQLPDRDAPIHQLSDEELLAEIKKLGGTEVEVVNHPELMKMLLGVLRADFEMAETYSPADSWSRLQCRVTTIAGSEDSIVDPDEIAAWRDVSEGDFSQICLPGGHFLVETNPQPLLAAVSEMLVKDLRTFANSSKKTPRPKQPEAQALRRRFQLREDVR